MAVGKTVDRRGMPLTMKLNGKVEAWSPTQNPQAVQDAVAVAVLWLDEVTSLASPAWRATGLSRAEWVDATMPRS